MTAVSPGWRLDNKAPVGSINLYNRSSTLYVSGNASVRGEVSGGEVRGGEGRWVVAKRGGEWWQRGRVAHLARRLDALPDTEVDDHPGEQQAEGEVPPDAAHFRYTRRDLQHATPETMTQTQRDETSSGFPLASKLFQQNWPQWPNFCVNLRKIAKIAPNSKFLFSQFSGDRMSHSDYALIWCTYIASRRFTTACRLPCTLKTKMAIKKTAHMHSRSLKCSEN